MSHSARASRALAHLGDRDPALSVLALWCRHIDGPGSTRTQGNTIHYGPTFTSMTIAEQVGLTAHHVLHVTLRHSERAAGLAARLGQSFDQTLYALAADAIINETLQLAEHALPRPAVLLTDLLTEIGTPAQSAVDALRDWDTDRLAMHLHADPQRASKARKYGKKRGFEADLLPAEPDSNEGQPSAADWRNHLTRAFEAGRKAGTGIGQFGHILADMAAPEVPWEVHLRGILARAVADIPRPSYRRPAGRWVAMSADATARGAPEPAFEPGQIRDTLRPRVVVGLDTSSSIDALTVALFCAETEGVSRRSGAEVHLLAFDETVHEARRLDPGRGGWPAPKLHTGGGTDFLPVIAAAAKLAPSILVMLTDLDAPAGPSPAFPVLWAVPGRNAVQVPFGRLLRIGN